MSGKVANQQISKSANRKSQTTDHAPRITDYELRITNYGLRITPYDVLLVGVGGQGVLTIGDLIAEAALRQGVPVSFYPTKGMAQRGGFVKAQLRLGRQAAGPAIPERGADLLVSMEVSETLKGVRFVKPGGEVVLFGQVWPPAAVMLGKAPYPALEQVLEQVGKETRGQGDKERGGQGGKETRGQGDKETGGQGEGERVHYLDPERLPLYEGVPVPANMFVLGAAVGRTGLGRVLEPAGVAEVVRGRWKRGGERNVFAFWAGVGGLGIGDCGLRIADCGLRIADCGLGGLTEQGAGIREQGAGSGENTDAQD